MPNETPEVSVVAPVVETPVVAAQVEAVSQDASVAENAVENAPVAVAEAKPEATAPAEEPEWDGNFDSLGLPPKTLTALKKRFEDKDADIAALETLLDIDPKEMQRLREQDKDYGKWKSEAEDYKKRYEEVEDWREGWVKDQFVKKLETEHPEVWNHRVGDTYPAVERLLERMNSGLPFDEAIILAKALVPKAPALVEAKPPPAPPRALAGSAPPRGHGNTSRTPIASDRSLDDAFAELDRRYR